MKERTDQEWIRLLKQNDQRTVFDLWEMLFTYGITLARRHRRDDDVGHDAAIEAYRRVRARGVYQFRFECSFRGYCRIIVLNEVRRLMGKQALPATELNEETVGQITAPRPVNPGELLARLQPCLAQLTSQEREVIVLRYSEGQDPETIAGRLGISRNYVNVIAHRARRKLRQCLEERGYESAKDVLSVV